MERSGVIVLALVSFVTGTPSGYGVKSGAVAKAEANAASSTFGGLPAVPLSIPSGGFSGSFSKSSSSSFSSSSSSASSSSSSYSFSGSGNNGIPGFGCQSNGCKNGANLVPFAPNNGVQNNGAAQAGAVASSIAGAGSIGLPCQGNNCNGFDTTNNNKCSSGECNINRNPSNDVPSNIDGSNCNSGQCKLTPLNNNNNPTEYKTTQNNGENGSKSNSNDATISYGAQFSPILPNKVNGKKYNSENKNEYDESQPKCSQDKCLQSPGKTGIPTDQNDIFIPNSPSGNTASSQSPDTFNSEPTCTSHNCHTSPIYNDGKLPSSYNVPIFGNNPDSAISGNNKQSEILYDLPKTSFSPDNCDGGACGDAAGAPSTKGSHLSQPSSYSHVNPPHIPQSPSLTLDCTGANCGASSIPDYKGPLSKPTCNTPNCGKYEVSGSDSQTFNGPTTNTRPNLKIQPGAFDAPKSTTNNGAFNKNPASHSLHYSTSNINPTTEQSLKYTGGFGGPTGFLSTSRTPGPQLALTPTQSSTPLPTHNLPHYNSNSDASGTTVTNNFNSVSISNPIDYGSTKPSINLVPPFENTPSKPKIPTGSEPSNGFSTPKQNNPTGSVSHDDSKSNHGPLSPHQNTATSPGILVGYKPSDSLLPPNENTPTGSGNYAGYKPSNNLTPHHQDTPTSSDFYSGSNPSSSFSHPNNPKVPGTYAGSKPPTHLIPNYTTQGSESYADSHRPTTAALPTRPTIPQTSGEKTYTGGFGAPTGLLKPNDYNLPANQPSSSSNHHNPTACLFPSCKNENVPGSAGAQQGTLFNGASAVSTASANAGIYTGGFGGPAGFLKPYDNNGQTKSGHYGLNENDQTNIQDTNTKNDVNIQDKSNLNNADGQTLGNAGAQVNAAAQANAVAFASSSAYSSNQGTGLPGCKTGCGSHYGTGPGYATSQGTSQTAGDAHVLGGASALSNSAAGAGIFGIGKSIASSSASAHASAGVKGGYGR